MCGFYCIAFIVYVLAGKTLLNYTNLFSTIDRKKNAKMIYLLLLPYLSLKNVYICKCFKDKYGRRSKY